MTSRKENEAWKEATVAEQVQRKGGGGRRKAPFYKVLQGMPIAVDAFKYGAIPGITAYFLTSVPFRYDQHTLIYAQSRAFGPLYKFILNMGQRTYLLLRGHCESYRSYAESG